MNRSVPVGEVRNLGDRALLVGVADPTAGRHLARYLDGVWPAGAVEIVGGFASVMLELADPRLELHAVRTVVDEAVRSGVAAPGAGGFRAGEDEVGTSAPDRVFTIPCAFDGPDLDEVAGARRAHAGATSSTS